MKADVIKAVTRHTSVLEKEIWNSAIEAAAKVAETQNVPQFYIAAKIKELKK